MNPNTKIPVRQPSKYPNRVLDDVMDIFESSELDCKKTKTQLCRVMSFSRESMRSWSKKRRDMSVETLLGTCIYNMFRIKQQRASGDLDIYGQLEHKEKLVNDLWNYGSMRILNIKRSEPMGNVELDIFQFERQRFTYYLEAKLLMDGKVKRVIEYSRIYPHVNYGQYRHDKSLGVLDSISDLFYILRKLRIEEYKQKDGYFQKLRDMAWEALLGAYSDTFVKCNVYENDFRKEEIANANGQVYKPKRMETDYCRLYSSKIELRKNHKPKF